MFLAHLCSEEAGPDHWTLSCLSAQASQGLFLLTLFPILLWQDLDITNVFRHNQKVLLVPVICDYLELKQFRRYLWLAEEFRIIAFVQVFQHMNGGDPLAHDNGISTVKFKVLTDKNPFPGYFSQ